MATPVVTPFFHASSNTWSYVVRDPASQEAAVVDAVLDFEFAVDAKLGKKARQPAASARVAELGWASRGEKHLCPRCQESAE